MHLGPPLLTFFDAPDAPGPRLLILPALGTPARVYRRLGEALAQIDIASAVLEWPGCGAHPVRASRHHNWGYRQLLEEQVLPAIEQLSAGSDGKEQRRVVLIGHSLGSHLALLARARGVPQIAGVVMIASGTPYYRVFALPFRLGILTLLTLVRIVTPLLGYYPGHRLGFAGREPGQLMLEWADFARTGRLLDKDNRHFHATQGSAEIPVRAFVLPGDTYAPSAATAHLLACAKLPETLIERPKNPALRGHFHWLREPKAAARLIADTLRSFR